MEELKSPHIQIVIIVVIVSIIFCCISFTLIPALVSEFKTEVFLGVLALIFFISSAALIIVISIDHKIYKTNINIIERNYQKILHNKTELILQDVMPSYIKNWCVEVSTTKYNNEKEVETKFIYPFMRFLGYKMEDIQMQYSTKVQVGRQAIAGIADFVIFDPFTKNPLLIIEAKHSSQKLDINVQNQARSYAYAINAPYYMVTNGVVVLLFKRKIGQDVRLLAVDVKNLHSHWEKFVNILGND